MSSVSVADAIVASLSFSNFSEITSFETSSCNFQSFRGELGDDGDVGSRMIGLSAQTSSIFCIPFSTNVTREKKL